MAKLHVTVVQFRTQRMNTDRVRITEWFEIQSALRPSLWDLSLNFKTA